MSKQTEALKLALEALNSFPAKHLTPFISSARTALREALAEESSDTEQPSQQHEECPHCLGSRWMPRDPDIGTDQECFVCDGTGVVETEQRAQQGWKLVPYDPSIDMQEHGSIASGYDLSQARAKRVYQAMIDMHDVMMEREATDQYLRLEAGYPEQPAQPQQEPVACKPVAWLGFSPKTGVPEFAYNMPAPSVMRDFKMRPLVYGDTSPAAQREPLTDEQEHEAIGTAGVDLLELAKLWSDNKIHVYQFDNEARKIIKGILHRAHVIKGDA